MKTIQESREIKKNLGFQVSTYYSSFSSGSFRNRLESANQNYLQICEQMKKVTIQAEYVTIQCFIGLKQHIFDELSHLNSCYRQQQTHPPKKILFLIHNLKLNEYSSYYDQLKTQFTPLFKNFYINILMAGSSKDIQEHLNHIRKVNQPIFQQNYLQLQEQSQKVIEQEIVQSYLLGKLKWNSIKSKYFMEKNKITSIKELIQYQSFPFFEKGVINKTISFMDFCKSQLAKRQENP